MNKALLKLGAIGAAITLLLALLIVTQGCTTKPQTENTTTLTSGDINNSTSGTGALLPSDDFEIPDTPDTEADDRDSSAPANENADIDVPIEDVPTLNETGSQPTRPDEQATQPSTDNIRPNDPTTQPSTEDTQTQTKVTYQDYLDMNDGQRLEFMNSFDDLGLFAQWLTQAKAEHEDDSQSATLDGNHADLEDLFKP